jgi:hypothetical protein
MRVAVVHRDLHQVTRGGICTLYLALADELVRAGHEIVLVTQDTPHPVLRAGVQVVTLPRTEDLAVHRAAVASAVERIAPDVAECSTWEAELLTYAQRPRRARRARHWQRRRPVYRRAARRSQSTAQKTIKAAKWPSTWPHRCLLALGAHISRRPSG